MNDKQKQQAIITLLDDILEESQKEYWSLRYTLEVIFNKVTDLVPIELDNFYIWTYDETFEKKLYMAKPDTASYSSLPYETIETLVQAHKSEVIVKDSNNYIPQVLDVAGEYFGFTCLCTQQTITDEQFGDLVAILHGFNETLDNYLQGIRNTRVKTLLLDKIAVALQNRKLELALQDVIAILNSMLAFDIFILYFWDPSHGESSIKYRIYKNGQLQYYSIKFQDEKIHRLMLEQGKKLMHNQDPDELFDFFNLDKFHIFKLTESSSKEASGILIMNINLNELNILNKDIIQNFCHFLLLRITDFNKEYNLLSRYFSKTDVHEIIEIPDYYKTVLNPKDKEIAIVYSDIAGFTAICEQILRDPTEIGVFVDAWIIEVCQIIWRNGGIVDKFVGDCAIGLFGPPFFRQSAKECCVNAIKAGIGIQQYTDSLNDHPRWQSIKESDIIDRMGVSTGINYTPVFVGSFGGNVDYTGFSSGMNNTARLQNVAECGQILVMNHIKNIVGEVSDFSFGEEGEAQAKNVKDKLRYHKVLW